ncbi:two-component system sensor histidine kinase CreC [Caenimonas aquaedulcis]|uniref:histidine kinase n=1 Tax=Caenimonas aquaedulcis TaxID=2793270 RepID=A0A931MI16_9BURK|nr:two-component system sensor histidine kinase CreC [Caenimonas aquaedulcis]MBG9389373.1 two-component system sensor histidine kinase CreC [Caenimonas aquaedulcis]
MRLGLRLFFAFFLIAGIAAFFVMRVFVGEVKPSVREAVEDILIDSANLLAEQATQDLRAMPPGGTLEGTRFAQSVTDYAHRPIDAKIWGLRKQALDFRVYVTDDKGRVVFDSAVPSAVGSDYSQWRDVALTLRGTYGARATREVYSDDRTSVMYVAAPVTDGGRVIGSLTVAKPQSAVAQFVARAERKIFVSGIWLLGLSLAIGVAVTGWMVVSVRKLRRYAQAAGAGERQPVPALPGELGDLAVAMGVMRERLAGQRDVEEAMRAMTHELKSPLAAIGAAAELLRDELPAADRERFSGQIEGQVDRLRAMVERLLELSKLESLQMPEHPRELVLLDLAQAELGALASVMAQRAIAVHWREEAAALVRGDAERISLAISNLLSNAVAFAPDGSTLELGVRQQGATVEFSVRDEGPGVPGYALAQLGQRFFSLPRPRDGVKGSGMGLAIARQVAALHGGSVRFASPGAGFEARLLLPAA